MCRSVSPSRLDWLLHHLRDLHGPDGRAGEGHVRLLQHPERDHHDDGLLNHVVSVSRVVRVSVLAHAG